MRRVLGAAGVSYLAPHVTHMISPNDRTRSGANRGDVWKRGVGWTSSGVTLTRPTVKYDVLNGQLVTIPAGELGANGRVEPATVTRQTNSNDKANWTLRGGTEALTDHASGGPANAPYVEATGISTQGVNDTWHMSSGFTADTALRLSLYVRRVSGAVALYVGNAQNDNLYGRYAIDLPSLPLGSWVRIDADSPYVTVDVAWKSTAEGLSGVIFWATAGIAFDFAFVNEIESQTYMTPILAAGGVTTRAVDAWSVADSGMASLASAGSLVAQLRLPYASTIPAANQYHVGLNGSDSTDDGIFIFTKATDDHLYAEARSGGAQEAEIDLGAYSSSTQYAVALSWDAAGLRACINGVEKTASGAITVPASIDRVNIGAGVSAHTMDGAEKEAVLIMDSVRTQSEREGLTSTAFRNAIAAGL